MIPLISVFKGGRVTASHLSAAAGIGLEQASGIADWSLHAGLALLEQACELATTLFGELVVGAIYLWEVLVSLCNLCVQVLHHVLHGKCKLLGIWFISYVITQLCIIYIAYQWNFDEHALLRKFHWTRWIGFAISWKQHIPAELVD